MTVGALALLIALFACAPGAAEPPAAPPPTAAASTTMKAPAMPDDVYIQLANLSTGWVYRVAEDGRFLVTPKGGAEELRPVMSKLERGHQTVSPRGLARMRTAVDEAKFFSLEDRVDGEPGRQSEEVVEQDLAFTVRGPDGPKTVAVRGALALPASLGALGPIYTAFDLEALGDWANE